MVVVSISMPDALLDEVDSFATNGGYSGRSEVVREGLRAVLAEARTQNNDDEPVLSTLLVFFAYGDVAVEQRVSRCRHEADELVVADAHGHVEDYCVEVLVADGLRSEIDGFAAALRSISGVAAVEESRTPLAAAFPAEFSIETEPDHGVERPVADES
ncbi:CopG family ribbon-helix-helix protein [Haloferacaceae archaeon DSL9]